MRSRTHLPAAVAALLGLSALHPSPAGAQDVEHGREVYEQWCSQCHGSEGDGQGPAAEYMIPRPRDFTTGLYQIRSTATGELPTDEDILRVINEGMPGTTMPGWEEELSGADREALVAYIKTFSQFFETLGAPEPLEFPGAPGASEERIAEGRLFYDSIQCFECHGAEGRGDGEASSTLQDDLGNPIRSADLWKAWTFNGGSTVEDIYERLRTGLDGTPMPNFSDLIDAGFMTDDQLWNLAHYVRSLSPEETPTPEEVIVVGQVAPGELPGQLADERWGEAESFYVPLVGQIIEDPRWFDPSVDGVWVQALHDGSEVAFRLTWHDRSRSPDPGWLEWQGWVLDAMAPREGENLEPAPRPDGITVQFPPTIPEGMDMPYFLMGDGANPVYQWQWSSVPGTAAKALARGLDIYEPLGAEGLASEAAWEAGRWQLLLRRALVPADPASELQFEIGVPIPIAFFAWDGDNSEEGARGSVSSWYFVQLEEETPPSTYMAPLFAFLFTGGLGVLVVRRAQRRDREVQAAAAGIVLPPEPRPQMARNFGFAVGALWLLFALAAAGNSVGGWAAGQSDVGFWWAVIAGFLTIAASVALIGTARHRYQGPRKS